MTRTREVQVVNILWLGLIGLTLFSAFMAEQDTQGLGSVTIMAVLLGIKGRIIIDYFMELKTANRLLRTLMQLYYYVMPVLILLVYLYPDQIARWATL